MAKRFSSLRTVSDVFRATLEDPDKAFAEISPARLLEAVKGECGTVVADWAEYMRERYGL